MPLTWPDKDPNEVLDYQLDWTARLSGDTITTSTWVVPADITKDSDSTTTTVTTIWLSGGDASNANGHLLTNRVVTAGGRTMEQSVVVRCFEK